MAFFRSGTFIGNGVGQARCACQCMNKQMLELRSSQSPSWKWQSLVYFTVDLIICLLVHFISLERSSCSDEYPVHFLIVFLGNTVFQPSCAIPSVVCLPYPSHIREVSFSSHYSICVFISPRKQHHTCIHSQWKIGAWRKGARKWSICTCNLLYPDT